MFLHHLQPKTRNETMDLFFIWASKHRHHLKISDYTLFLQKTFKQPEIPNILSETSLGGRVAGGDGGSILSGVLRTESASGREYVVLPTHKKRLVDNTTRDSTPKLVSLEVFGISGISFLWTVFEGSVWNLLFV